MRACGWEQFRSTCSLSLSLSIASIQLGILRTQWWVILRCAIFQYVHGIFTQLAYRVHVPAPEPLPDLGFKVLPVRERGHA